MEYSTPDIHKETSWSKTLMQYSEVQSLNHNVRNEFKVWYIRRFIIGHF